jgi:hypothetical protein
MHRGEVNNAFLIFLKLEDEDILMVIIRVIWGCYAYISKELYLDSAAL